MEEIEFYVLHCHFPSLAMSPLSCPRQNGVKAHYKPGSQHASSMLLPGPIVLGILISTSVPQSRTDRCGDVEIYLQHEGSHWMKRNSDDELDELYNHGSHCRI